MGAVIGGIAGGAISALGGIMGNSISASGQRDANAAMIAQSNKIMDWESQMSNTAMVRRVADLKAAGLNPLLAVGQGGASTPGMSPVSLGNPGAAYANMGAQMSSAVQAGSNVASTIQQAPVNAAQANNLQAEADYKTVLAGKAAGVDTSAVQQNIMESKTRQDLMDAQSQAEMSKVSLNNAQIRVAEASVPKIQAEIQNIVRSTSNAELESHIKELAIQFGDMNNAQFKYISPSLVMTAANAARESAAKAQLAELDVPGAINAAKVQQGNPGVAYVDAVMNWLHLGANISGRR